MTTSESAEPAVVPAGVREAPPVFGAASPDSSDPATPDVPQEPLLEIDDIQGNLLTGFNKDHVELLFVEIEDATAAKAWLAQICPAVATAAEVLAFNRLFKETKTRRGFEGAVKSTWINIAFSATGLSKLTADAAQFVDPSFQAGLAARSTALNDPVDPAEGAPEQWRVGGPTSNADVVLIVASDDVYDLLATVTHLEDSIYAFRSPQDVPVASGVRVVYKQRGETQTGALAGHEHFGWLDGVSQPGLRGRISEAPGDVLTARQNAADPDQGKPGQDLLWPGEFIFGYPSQDRTSVATPGMDSLQSEQGEALAPAWARNGAYFVVRRLRQDVGGFHEFLKAQAQAHTPPLSPGAVGSRLVGRWPSGAPVMRTPMTDDAALGHADCANNHFEFQDATTASAGVGKQCDDSGFPASAVDAAGLICPFSSHIRKSYPRDDEVVPEAPNPYASQPEAHTLNEADTQTHRLLRRGIPYGPSSTSTPEAPLSDHTDRGLLFMAYMTSIVDQFEFVTQNWVNDPAFKAPGTGPDPILGQAPSGGPRDRVIQTVLPGASAPESMALPTDWVIPTGGGYFFAPSISALIGVIAGAT